MYCTVNTTTFVNSVEILVNIKPLVGYISLATYLRTTNVQYTHVYVYSIEIQMNGSTQGNITRLTVTYGVSHRSTQRRRVGAHESTFTAI